MDTLLLDSFCLESTNGYTERTRKLDVFANQNSKFCVSVCVCVCVCVCEYSVCVNRCVRKSTSNILDGNHSTTQCKLRTGMYPEELSLFVILHLL